MQMPWDSRSSTSLAVGESSHSANPDGVTTDVVGLGVGSGVDRTVGVGLGRGVTVRTGTGDDNDSAGADRLRAAALSLRDGLDGGAEGRGVGRDEIEGDRGAAEDEPVTSSAKTELEVDALG